jgi:hypothetical protein
MDNEFWVVSCAYHRREMPFRGSNYKRLVTQASFLACIYLMNGSYYYTRFVTYFLCDLKSSSKHVNPFFHFLFFPNNFSSYSYAVVLSRMIRSGLQATIWNGWKADSFHTWCMCMVLRCYRRILVTRLPQWLQTGVAWAKRLQDTFNCCWTWKMFVANRN